MSRRFPRVLAVAGFPASYDAGLADPASGAPAADTSARGTAGSAGFTREARST